MRRRIIRNAVTTQQLLHNTKEYIKSLIYENNTLKKEVDSLNKLLEQQDYSYAIRRCTNQQDNQQENELSEYSTEITELQWVDTIIEENEYYRNVVNNMKKEFKSSRRRELKFQKENEQLKKIIDKSDNNDFTFTRGTGIGKYFDDGILSILVESLYPAETDLEEEHNLRVANGTPFYHIKLRLKA